MLKSCDLEDISEGKMQELCDKTANISSEILQSLCKRARLEEKSSQQYCREIREFSLSLHNASPKAYRYVREALDNTFPNERTIRRWMSKLDCSPGFHQQALKHLKEEVDKQKMLGKKIYCCLIMDEIHLKSHVSFN